MASTRQLDPPRAAGPTGPPGRPTPTAPPAPPGSRPRRRRLRLALRITLGILTVILLVAGGIVWWALDRYVIDHVEIADVAGYEAQMAATTTVGTTPAGGAATTAAAPAVTATSYTSDTTSITISTVVTGTGRDRVTYYVADIVVDDATQLRGGFAQNKYGTNIVEDTSAIAARYDDAVLAINGDYYGYRRSGILIRNGVLYRDDGARTGLAIYRDGTMAIYDETTTTGEELLAAGVWDTVSFGPALVDGGEVVEGIEDVEVDTNIGNHSIQGNQPRTGIGMIAPNHFVFVVVDGRSTGYSRGLTMTELAEVFVGLGATVAYNLDGGGSATMVFNGELVNNPVGRADERPTSDILYIAAGV